MTDKLELKSSHEVIYTVDVADVESIFYCKPTDPDILTVLMKDGKRLYCDEVCTLQKEPVSEGLEEASKEWLRPQLDKSYANYGEAKMMELTRFDGYAMLDAIEFGAKWQKEQDQSIIELAEDHAMFAGMEKMREQMIKDVVEAECDVTLLEEGDEVQYNVLYPKGERPHHKGDKVKLIIIKED